MTSCLRQKDEKYSNIPNTLDQTFRILLTAVYGRNTPTLLWLLMCTITTAALLIGLLAGSVIFDEQMAIAERQVDRIDDLERTINNILAFADYSILGGNVQSITNINAL